MSQHKIQIVAVTWPGGDLTLLSFFLDPNLLPDCNIVGYNPDTGQRDNSDEAIDAEIAKAFQGRKPDRWRRIDPVELPESKTFLAAWRDSGTHVFHDMEHCRELRKTQLRAERAPLLADLDVQLSRANESSWNGKEKAAIIARKNELRHITADPRIEAATTPEELLQVKP